MKSKRKVDGPLERRPVQVLLSAEERSKIEAALEWENTQRGLSLGIGPKLRELGLVWAKKSTRDEK